MRRRLSEIAAIEYSGDEQILICEHCGERLPSHRDGNPLAPLALYEGPVTDAGPTMWPQPSDFVDEEVVFRQYCCPSCFTAMATIVVPRGHVLPEDRLM